MLTDGLDPTLKKWLEGTNWPDGFKYEHKLKMVKNYIAQEVTIRRGIDSMTIFVNPKKLSRSEFDYFIASAIKNIQGSSKISERYNVGKAALK